MSSRRFMGAPDLHLIPEDLRPLVTESKRLRSDHNQLQVEVKRLGDAQLDVKAVAADKDHLGAEVRAGRTPKQISPNVDKLKAERDALAINRARSEAAVHSVNAELDRWFTDNGERLQEFAADSRDDAIRDYLAAVEGVTQARHAYHVATRAADWAARATDGRESMVNWSPVQIDDYPMQALRKEIEGTKQHRTTVAGFAQ